MGSASDGTFIDRVTVSWNLSSGATGYKVYRNTSDNSATAGGPIASPNASPYPDFAVPAEQTTYYWVKACNSAGCSDYSASDMGWRSSGFYIFLPLFNK